MLDIPLLFETGRDGDVDRIVVVSAPADVQRARALARPGMTEEKFAAILARQLPDAEKRKRADFIVDSGQGLRHARGQVRHIIDALSQGDSSLMREIILDTETTGIDPAKGHRIVEIGAVELDQSHSERQGAFMPISIPSATCRPRRRPFTG